MLANEIANTYFNVPKSNFAKVYINKEYYGLFVNNEAVSDGYLQRVFGTASGSLVKPKEAFGTPLEQCLKNVFGSLVFEKQYNCIESNFDLLQGDLEIVANTAFALNNAGQY
ncbi:MAG: CotH kinase family protein [Saprospiraceae bacterium]